MSHNELPDEIRASISPKSIERVARFFDASLEQTLQELFQNARRAGATRILVDVDEEGAIVVEDDGTGIPDPRILLECGGSRWPRETAANEAPAGMGLYALARTRACIRTWGRDGRGWETELRPEHWDGREAAPIVRLDRRSTRKSRSGQDGKKTGGTRVRFFRSEQPTGDPRSVRRESAPHVSACALYLPVPVFFGGEEQVRKDFLEGAKNVTEWQGLRIGVFEDHGTNTIEHGLNFLGVRAEGRLRAVKGLDGTTWTTGVDVIRCPQLELTLPTRSKVIETVFMAELRRQALRRIYETIGADPRRPDLPARDHREATDMGVPLPEARARLTPFCPPQSAHEEEWELPNGLHQTTRAVPTETGKAIIVCSENPLAQLAARALREAGLEDQAFGEDNRLEGYRWYDRLRKLEVAGLVIGVDGETVKVRDTSRPRTVSPGSRTSTTVGYRRVDSIELQLRNRNDGSLRTLGTSIGFGDIGATEPDEIGVLVTNEFNGSIEELSELATDAFWTPGEDTDSWSREDWAERVRWQLTRLLVSKAEADRHAIANAFHERMREIVGDAEEVVLHYRKGQALEVRVER